MTGKPIFIHSLFRTGSTYIWNKFRQNDNYYCYYEPLHPALAHVTKDNIENLMTKDFGSVNHPSLNKYYLYEYSSILDTKGPGVRYFKKSFSFDEFCNNKKNPALKKYIDHLIYNAGEKTPLFQFNRTALRVKWFKENYPDSLNIYLVRQPRDQWQSYFEIQQKTNYSVFFVMDLLTASINKKTGYFKPLARSIPLLKHRDRSFEKDEKFYRLLLDSYPGEERYFIFYYTWLRALIENVIYADFVLNINLLSQDTVYREAFSSFLKINDINDIDFEDSRLSKYSSYLLSQEVMTEIEEKSRQLLLQSIPTQMNLFFEKLSSFDEKYFQFQRESFTDLPLNKKEETLKLKEPEYKKLKRDIQKILNSHMVQTGKNLLLPCKRFRRLLKDLKKNGREDKKDNELALKL